MDDTDLTLIEPRTLIRLSGRDVEATLLEERLTTDAVSDAEEFSDKKKMQVAKDFESLLLGKLMDQVERTVGGWDSEEEAGGASGQVRGLFWMFLAREIADSGGFGLWKDVYRSLSETGAVQTSPQEAGEDK
jgi:Rod binding domain-containing protein